MKLYPTTNTIVAGNDIQAERLNQEVRECFETVNGGIDQYNLEEGGTTCAGAGLSSIKFASQAWNRFIINSGVENAAAGSIFQTATNSTSVGQHRFATDLTTDVKAGVVKGTLQIRYWLNSLQLSNQAKIDYDSVKYEIDPTVDFSVYANGAKVGETDTVSKGSHGVTTIPFYFYHPGGTIRWDYYCNANGGEADVMFTMDRGFRMLIQNYLLIANVRVR